MLLRVRHALALLVLVPLVAAAQPPDHAAEIRAFEKFVQEKMESLHITGLSVAVSKANFQWARGFGYADLENMAPARAESSYRMASVTKPMTAVGVLKLVELGKVELDAAVQRYVPDFPRKSYPITIRQLLAHLGGISHYRNYDVEGRLKEPKTTREALALFQDFDLVAEPGTRYNYTSYGYNLLGAVIEGASGEPYGEFMHEHVWGPLGMADTRMDSPRDLIPNRVRGYERSGGALRNSEYVDISSRFAAGGTRSTVLDMVKFVRGLEAGKVLGRATLDLMWTESATRAGAGIHYGLGWGIEGVDGRFELSHGGGQQETRTYLLYVPRQRFVVAVATNLEGARPALFADRLAALFLGGSRSIRLDAATAADRARLAAIRGVFDEGLAHHDRHGAALTLDPREVAAAFHYFADTLREERLAAASGEDARLRQGRDPSAGRPWTVAGSYIVHSLIAAGRGDLDTYQRQGPIRLFRDYVMWYRAAGKVPKAARLSRANEARVMRWAADWPRVWDGDPLLAVVDARDLARLESSRAGWRAASVRPSYESDLVSLAESSAEEADLPLGLRSARLAAELYPDSDATLGVLGVLTLVSGDRVEGERLVRRAHALQPAGYAAPDNLRRIAAAVRRSGNPTGAAALMELASALPAAESTSP